MTMKNELKQLARTPVKTVSFLALISMSAALLTVGLHVWMNSTAKINEYKKSFSTIGTVEQEQSSVKAVDVWDAEFKEYSHYTRPTYHSVIPVSVMDFSGANYDILPQKRPYYGSYCPEYKLYDVDELSNYFLVVEVMPIEDCVPDHPVKLKVNRVLFGNVLPDMTIWFCDHNNPKPDQFYANQTYVMSLSDSFPHADYEAAGYEYIPAPIDSTQVTEQNQSVDDDDNKNKYYDIVSENFYESQEGKKWKALPSAIEKLLATLPVQPVDSTNLLMPFYNGDAYVIAGKDISNEEYAQGKKVCMIPEDFAERNNLDIGDSLHLSLYYSDYKDTPGIAFRSNGWAFRFGLVNSEGEGYQVFQDSTYEIIGIYNSSYNSDLGMKYAIGINEVIIPSKSVENSDQNNVVADGPMQGFNTSFKIENGEIESFMDKWEILGIEGLNISFYDNGFTNLSDGINNMTQFSYLLLISGGIVCVFIIILFGSLFIGNQQERMAIEISLGTPRKQCKKGLIKGMLLLTLTGVIMGLVIGTLFVSRMTFDHMTHSYYSEKYSNGAKTDEVIENDKINVDIHINVVPTIGCGICILFLTWMIGLANCRYVMKMEPIQLLQKRKE